jgi:hypothetical protein
MQDRRFLMIGSMKSGTTSIFDDLTCHPQVYETSIKEPGDLASDAIFHAEAQQRYLSLFAKAGPGQWCGEATTLYAQYPHVTEVPQRAHALFGPTLKLIFVGRDPVERIRSHYRHEVQKKTYTQPLAEMLGRDPKLFDLSRYDLQIAQWLKVFERENLLVLQMEDYISDPDSFMNRIFAFLELGPSIHPAGHHANRSAGKREAQGLLRKLIRSRFYGQRIKPMLPHAVRVHLRQLLVPRGRRAFDDMLSLQEAQELGRILRDETQTFRQMAQDDRLTYQRRCEGWGRAAS